MLTKDQADAALSTLIGVGAELAAPDRMDAGGHVIIAARDSAQETINEGQPSFCKQSRSQ